MEWNRNCDRCGKFIKNIELEPGGGGSHVFVPDSDVSHEELRWRCKKCTSLHGKPLAFQTVNHDICSIIF